MNKIILLAFLLACLTGATALSGLVQEQYQIADMLVQGSWLAIPLALIAFIAAVAFLWWMVGNDL